MTRSRRLAITAVISLAAAGGVLNERQTTDTRPTVRASPTSTPPAAITPTPTPAISPAPNPSSAERIAEAYTLAATNWSARTYVVAYRHRLGLAAGPLRADLRRNRPTRWQLQELRGDQASRLGAVLRTRATNVGARADTRVLVDVDELHFAAGQRTRQSVRYELRARRERNSWRVLAFTAVRGGR